MSDTADENGDTVILDCIRFINAEDGQQPVSDSKIIEPPPDHRIGRRKQVTRRMVLVVRSGTLGLGPDIACGLVDVAEDGLGVRLKQAVPAGQEVTIELSAPGVSKPQRFLAEVRWCQPGDDGTFRAGVRLRRRLPYAVLTDLTR